MSACADLAARLAALRGTGAWRLDPARFHYLEALARRMDDQAEPVRALLRPRLAAAIAQYEQRATGFAPPRAAAVPGRPPATALVGLASDLRDAAKARAAAAAPGEIAPEHELASARRFRQAWQAGRTLDQVGQALQRRPANAGPLNSHALVLHSLALMRELSPAYLRRFLAVAESLQWLEQAGAPSPSSASPKTTRKRRPARNGQAAPDRRPPTQP